MIWSEAPLNNMLDIIPTYIVFHNLCNINNEEIEKEWIIEEEKNKKQARRFIEGDVTIFVNRRLWKVSK